MFARLIFFFVTEIKATQYPWAYIQPCDSPIGSLTSKEIDLELFCICAQPCGTAKFVDARLRCRLSSDI
jgi:hypothetical protein